MICEDKELQRRYPRRKCVKSMTKPLKIEKNKKEKDGSPAPNSIRNSSSSSSSRFIRRDAAMKSSTEHRTSNQKDSNQAASAFRHHLKSQGGRTKVIGRWETLEKLLLGGAVLRYGTQDWNLIAAELRARSTSPDILTPEICKAKYEDLQEHYPGNMIWFEMVKKQRIAELKRDLKRTENSIESLKSKIKSLKAEKKRKQRDDSPMHGYKENLDLSKSKKVKRLGRTKEA